VVSQKLNVYTLELQVRSVECGYLWDGSEQCVVNKMISQQKPPEKITKKIINKIREREKTGI